ncbi:hypothetical protein [Paraburkholderia tropica]|uniref:hypothetical protein n=1 Tax=Paraburkholderia tropica TaxID=92647 RepID=UPI002AB62AF0|nr:hypothetical protein [Paraburkholderia tropica]
MQFLRNLSGSLRRNRSRLPFLPGFNQDLQPYVATVDVDYVQRVMVGVEATSAEHAQQMVRRAYDAGTLWNDTTAMPVLMHAFEPVNPESPLQLVSLEQIDELPPADPSVCTMKCVSSSWSLLRFARVIDELLTEALDPDDARTAYVGIDVPMKEVTELRQLLRTLDPV